MNPQETWRLFVALPVPDAVRKAINVTARDLASRLGHGTVRWVAPEQYHITLRFLGDVAAVRVQELIGRLVDACRLLAPVEFKSGGIGTFPAHGTPRVIWAGLTDCDRRLTDIYKAVVIATNDFTAQSPEPELVGHITLGRVKFMRPEVRSTLFELTTALAGRQFGASRADFAELICSRLSSQGSVYETVARFPLGTQPDDQNERRDPSGPSSTVDPP